MKPKADAVCIFCFVIFSFFLVAELDGAVMFSRGPCPRPYQTGNTWRRNSQVCEQCHCYDRGYTCYSCGVGSVHVDTRRCYTFSDREAVYPECCQIRVKCRGDPGFDENMILG